MFNSKDEEIRELFCENNNLWCENTELKEKIFNVIDYIKENFSNEDGTIWHEDMKVIYKILGVKNER